MGREEPGRTALVVGAAGAIGGAIAHRLRDDGYRVIAADLWREGLERLEADVTGVRTIQADVATPEGAEVVVDAVDGPIDVLTCSVGVSDGGASVDELNDDLWNRVLRANLQSTYLMCNRVLPGMLREGSGVIVNVASVAGLRGGRAGAAYTASKWAMVGLSQNIAASLGPEGIRCHAVCPSQIEGAKRMGIDVQRTARGQIRRNRDTARPPAGKPEDVAALTSFLVSDAAGHLNGLAIPADGGWLAY